MIELVNEGATAVTHGGVFHADDIFSTVLAEKILGKVKLARVFRIDNINTEDKMVYDIGLGQFDHHQANRECRENGIPYAAFGLLWREFGMQICQQKLEDAELAARAADMFEDQLVLGIDAQDNGYAPCMPNEAGMNISCAIRKMNPRWDEETTADEKFLQAVELARNVFDATLDGICSNLRAASIVEKAIDEAADGIMVLKQYLPWQGTLLTSQNPKAEQVLFAVFPSLRGGWNWQGVPAALGSFEQRKPSPAVWHGQPASVLRELTGLETVTFCHANGFLGACGTREDAIAMARMAID